jgi:hypothetical protein
MCVCVCVCVCVFGGGGGGEVVDRDHDVRGQHARGHGAPENT